jgi:hypothetical protein
VILKVVSKLIVEEYRTFHLLIDFKLDSAGLWFLPTSVLAVIYVVIALSHFDNLLGVTEDYGSKNYENAANYCEDDNSRQKSWNWTVSRKCLLGKP